LREDSGAHEWRPGHGEDAGRRRRNCGSELVSADQVNHRGRGQTEGRPGLRVIRRSLLRQQTRRGLDGDGGTGARPWRAAAELLGARAVRERGRECSTEGATGQGRANERGQGPEKARARGGVARNRAVVGASTVESAGGSEGKGPTDGPQGSERERASERVSALTSGTHG
jgi:hypothetical protein